MKKKIVLDDESFYDVEYGSAVLKYINCDGLYEGNDLVIPDTIMSNGHEYCVTDIDLFDDEQVMPFAKVDTLYIGKYVTSIPFNTRYAIDYNHIVISPRNGHLASEDDIVFTKDRTCILDGHTYNKEVLNIDGEVNRIAEGAFYENEYICEIYCGPKLAFLEKYCFYGLSKLETIEFKAKSLFYALNCISNCPSLKHVSIPTEYMTFNGVSPKGKVYWKDGFFISDMSGFKTLLSFTNNNIDNLVIPEDIKVIGTSAFVRCSFKSVKFNKGLTHIFSYAFTNCLYLDKIEFSDDILYIGSGSFYNIPLKGDIILPSSLEYIGDEAFGSIKDINKITFRHKLFHLGNKINTVSKAVIDIPDEFLPDGCRKINNLIIDKGKEVIDVIDNSVTSIEIPEGVTTFPDGLFHFMDNLENVSLPSTLELIPNEAFYHCSKLKEIVMPDSVKEVGAGAFAYCSSLAKVVLSKNVTLLPRKAFYECFRLKEFINLDNLEKVDFSTFDYSSISINMLKEHNVRIYCFE